MARCRAASPAKPVRTTAGAATVNNAQTAAVPPSRMSHRLQPTGHTAVRRERRSWT